MEPKACLRAQAKIIEPSASSWSHIEGSQNVSMMLSEAGSYAQAWHNVHTASTCAFYTWLQTYFFKSMKSRIEAQAWHNVHTANTRAYNTWLQKWVYNLSRVGLKHRLGTKCTWPVHVQTTRVVLSDVLGGKDVVEGRDGWTDGRTDGRVG
jgi:hypothetical protein